MNWEPVVMIMGIVAMLGVTIFIFVYIDNKVRQRLKKGNDTAELKEDLYFIRGYLDQCKRTDVRPAREYDILLFIIKKLIDIEERNKK